jgi:hypothetical protein
MLLDMVSTVGQRLEVTVVKDYMFKNTRSQNDYTRLKG